MRGQRTWDQLTDDEKQQHHWKATFNDYVALRKELHIAVESLEFFHEVLVGRDTHPLTIGGGANAPRLFIAIEGLRLLHQARSLRDHIDIEIDVLNSLIED